MGWGEVGGMGGLRERGGHLGVQAMLDHAWGGGWGEVRVVVVGGCEREAATSAARPCLVGGVGWSRSRS